MNIKSLLLGSAAALVAVSGAARAADAIVNAEPEPAEYVRVCDVYGKGFYYIPGTETCIKVGGYVRYQYNFDQNATIKAGGVETGGGYDGLSKVRARLNFDVREETELGTLRGYVRLQAQNSNGADSATYQMKFGYLQLGGLTAGLYDSLWTSDIGGAEDGLLTDSDLALGDRTANLVSYTYAMDGLTGTLSLENPVFSKDNRNADTDDSFDVVAKIAYSAGWGGAYVAGVYDSDADVYYAPGLKPANSEEGYAVKLGAWVDDLLLADSTFKVEGHYAPEKTDFATLDTTYGSRNAIPLQWTAGVGYSVKFGKLGVAVAGRYGETFDSVVIPDGKALGVVDLVGNVGYDITKNLNLLTEVTYQNIEQPAQGTPASAKITEDKLGGFVRLQRNF